MAEQDDVLHLIDDSVAAPEATSSVRKWKIAVIDDDAAVHEGTRFALSDYSLIGASIVAWFGIGIVSVIATLGPTPERQS